MPLTGLAERGLPIPGSKMEKRPKNQAPFHRPFEGLGDRLRKRRTDAPAATAAKRCAASPPRHTEQRPTPLTAAEEQALFQAAMADVVPLDRGNRYAAEPDPGLCPVDGPDPDAEALAHLRRLVAGGDGFVVSQTPEYMEGTDGTVHPSLAGRLHAGTFAIQDHVDLHGLTAAQADDALDGFLRRSVRTGKRGVLIVHGRGLRSAGEPVLKGRVRRRLTRGRWCKWVMAYASARSVDGGAGATYVLLRERPLPKRMRRTHLSDF